MQLLSVLSTGLTLACTITAAAAAPAPPSKTLTSSHSYLLQAHVVKGGHEEFEGLYLSASHTGAGTNDAVLVKDKKSAVRGELVDGVQYIDLNYPFTFWLYSDVTYDAWYPVQIGVNAEIEEGSKVFFNATGLQTDQYGFGGWLACHWSRAEPQLFWQVNYAGYIDYPRPGCAQVELRPVEEGKTFSLKPPTST